MRFVNTSYFSEAGNYYLKNGVYTNALPDTLEHDAYWNEELNRCINGYSVAGCKITGDHYFYLNYCLINLIEDPTDDNRKYVSKVISLPKFWDGDYEFFWVREIAKNGISLEDYKKLELHSKVSHLAGGKHLICGKSRRKGFSFKTASIATKTYLLEKASITLVCAFEEKYVKDNMSKALEYTNHLNSITNPSPFARAKLIDTNLHIKSGYKVKVGGIEVAKGDKSEILGITFKDKPDAARGKDPKLVIMEEAGTFTNIKDAFAAIRPSLYAGNFMTGQAIILGTGGKMESSTIGFSEMFYNPEPYELLAFDNIYDEEFTNKPCGFFWPVYLNKEGFTDIDGNSDKEGAIQSELINREELKKTAEDKKQLTKYVTEQPFTPKEAFSISNTNIFNVYELDLHLRQLQAKDTVDTLGIRGLLTISDSGKVTFEKNDNLHECVYPVTQKDKHAGCVVIYEFPPEDYIPESLYISSLDPYAQNKSNYSSSLGACYIYKRSMVGETTGDRLVAAYVGRPETLKEFNETIRRLLIFYNAKCLYENQINNIKEYFENKNCLYLLADTPTCLKATVNSLVRRGKGIHMTKDIKLELEVYLRDWLVELNSEGVPNYKFIYDKSLLKELISYNDTGNFDRVIALMLIVIYKIQLTKITVEKRNQVVQDSFLTRKLFSNRHIHNGK